jgi:ABC-type molybdenum transport system ATPase subunit/photorepair protein PhrA
MASEKSEVFLFGSGISALLSIIKAEAYQADARADIFAVLVLFFAKIEQI